MNSLRTPEEIAAIVDRAVGPIIHNVVSSCVDLSHTAGERRSLIQMAWLMYGNQNTHVFASPCKLAFTSLGYKTTLLVFNSGRFVVTGASNEKVTVQCLYRVFECIARETGIVFVPSGLIHTNMQSVVYMFAELNLEAVKTHFCLSANSLYNPEKINHVKLTVKDVTVLVYQSGTLILTGASQREQLVEAMNEILPQLAHFVVAVITDPEQIKKIKAKGKALLKSLDKDELSKLAEMSATS